MCLMICRKQMEALFSMLSLICKVTLIIEILLQSIVTLSPSEDILSDETINQTKTLVSSIPSNPSEPGRHWEYMNYKKHAVSWSK